jgi:hypothetical protein
MMVSKSGFIINEIYIELKRAMQSHDYERVCYWSAELVCSSQIKQLVSWIISLCCTEYVNTNCFISAFVISKCNYIIQEKYKWKSNEVREALCEIVLFISQEEPATSTFYKHGASYKTFINSLYFKKNKEFRELKDNLGYIPHNEVYILINYLYEFMLINDIKSVFRILYHIVQMNGIEECETLDIVRNIKKNKTDPVWVLWSVLFIFTKRPPCDPIVQKYIESSFNIFSIEYTKKIRNERMNILFICYLLCVKRKSVTYVDTYPSWISTNAKQVHVIYDDILRKENKEKEAKALQSKIAKENEKTKKGGEIKEKKIAVKKDKNGTLTQEEKKELNEKMRWFFCLTYKDPNRINAQKYKETILQEQPYKMFDVEYDDYSSDMPRQKGALRLEKL